MKSAYISCPMTVSQTVLDEVIGLIKDNADPYWWKKGSNYNEDDYTNVIQTTNVFIVILPDLAWSCEGHKMTSGSRKELTLAVKAKKPIYLAYRNKNDGLGIYAADVKTAVDGSSGIINPDNIVITSITGIASTRYNFRDSANAPTYIQQKGRVNRNAISNRQQTSNLGQDLHAQLSNGLSKDKTWLESFEQEYRQYMEKAIFPVWVDTSVIPKDDIEDIIKCFEQTGVLLDTDMLTNMRLGIATIPHNRILLFF